MTTLDQQLRAVELAVKHFQFAAKGCRQPLGVVDGLKAALDTIRAVQAGNFIESDIFDANESHDGAAGE